MEERLRNDAFSVEWDVEHTIRREVS